MCMSFGVNMADANTFSEKQGLFLSFTLFVVLRFVCRFDWYADSPFDIKAVGLLR